MSLTEAKNMAVQAVRHWSSGAKCVEFEESDLPGFEFEGRFEFPTGLPAFYRFWVNPDTGNMLFLEVKP